MPDAKIFSLLLNSKSIAEFSQLATLPENLRQPVTLSLTGKAGSSDAIQLSAMLSNYTQVQSGSLDAKILTASDAAILVAMQKNGSSDAASLLAILSSCVSVFM